MASRFSDLPTNIVKLHLFEESSSGKQTISARDTQTSDGNDVVIADGLQLVRSFLLIEDRGTRRSIIQIVEKIAEQNRIFAK